MGEGGIRGMLETLLCFVLTDGAGGHAFCSRYDLGPWPLLAGVKGADDAAASALAKCKAVFVNGFLFDEMKASAVGSAISLAKANGAGVFFDPGPRAFTFVRDPERRDALDTILGAADVVLATLEEAAALVDDHVTAATSAPVKDNDDEEEEEEDVDEDEGVLSSSGGSGSGGGSGVGSFAEAGHDALAAGTAVGASFAEAGLEPREVARALLSRRGCNASWIVIKCGPDGAALFTRDGVEARVGSPVVDVGDTVGCGDSAAAAVVLGYLNVAKARRQRQRAATSAFTSTTAAAAAAAGKEAEEEDVLSELPREEMRTLLEETLALATAVGAATATGVGAGRNVATAEKVRSLLDDCVCRGGFDAEACGFGVTSSAAERAKAMLDASLAERDRRK